MSIPTPPVRGILGRKRRDSTPTKNRIDRAALEMFTSKGVHAATVRDIADLAGVAEGSLYRHYAGKDALAKALYVQHAGAITAALLEIHADCHDLEAFLSSCVITLCQLYESDPLAFAFVFFAPPSTLAFLEGARHHPQHQLASILEPYLKQRAVDERTAPVIAAQILGTILQPASSHASGLLPTHPASYADELVLAALRIVR